MIRNLNRDMGTTMVIVTHDLDLVFGIVDRVIMLDRDSKGIIGEGPPQFLRQDVADPRVHNFFNRKKAVC